MPADRTLTWRANPVSAVEMMASATNYNKMYRTRFLRRRRPGVTQANSLLTVYTPLNGPGNSVMIGKADRWHAEYEAVEVAKREMTDAERRIALATNTAGVVAAPGLVYMAAKGAKKNEGGVPRAIARAVGDNKRTGSTKAGKKLKKIVRNLDRPKTGPWKKAAAATGAGLVGLQLVNSAGDAIAARAMANSKKRK